MISKPHLISSTFTIMRRSGSLKITISISGHFSSWNSPIKSKFYISFSALKVLLLFLLPLSLPFFGPKLIALLGGLGLVVIVATVA
ncbi:hypothetical protein LguiA_000242 [Lonicera macranthoides]